MCSIYVHADPMQYESRTRSIRIDNVVTTIRLENQFWDVLAEMAEKEGQTTNQLVSTLHGELFALREDTPNFASFLRVSCLRYLSLQQAGEMAHLDTDIRTLPALSTASSRRH